MKIKEPKNVNYCATIAEVTATINFDNCDNVVGAIVCGSHVIVGNDVQKGEIGVFFPIETKLSQEFLSNNNLYRDATLNVDAKKKGYFEANGRLRAVKFRGHKSEGLFVGVESISFTMEKGFGSVELGDEFDELNGIPICEKYFVPKKQSSNNAGKNAKRKLKRISKLVENQFRLHINTAQLKKNIHAIDPNQLISITNKLHGTSAVFANVLTNRKLTLRDKVAKLFGCNVKTTEYAPLYSSRNVVKNEFHHVKGEKGFYSTDIWKEWNNKVEMLIPKGYSIYGEIVGYQSSGQWIQKDYHYGQMKGTSELYIYRVTFTNEDGEVMELNRPALEEFVTERGLKATPSFYYGLAKNVYKNLTVDDDWHENFLARLEVDEEFGMNDFLCDMNNNEVPSEGCVIRIESNDPTPYKLKNYAFYERETKMLDAGEEDIEEEN